MDYIVCGISREVFSLERVGPEIVSAGDVVIAQRLRNIWRQEQAIGLGSEQYTTRKEDKSNETSPNNIFISKGENNCTLEIYHLLK